jgi:hypothetical protein
MLDLPWICLLQDQLGTILVCGSPIDLEKRQKVFEVGCYNSISGVMDSVTTTPRDFSFLSTRKPNKLLRRTGALLFFVHAPKTYYKIKLYIKTEMRSYKISAFYTHLGTK